MRDVFFVPPFSFSANQVLTFAVVTHRDKLSGPPEAQVSGVQLQLPVILYVMIAISKLLVGYSLAMYNTNTDNSAATVMEDYGCALCGFIPRINNGWYKKWKLICKLSICRPM